MLFSSPQGTTNSWLRVIPKTKFGAFARGAKVVVYTRKSGPHTRIIDGGSGYLCEMEPVAHFGLGKFFYCNCGTDNKTMTSELTDNLQELQAKMIV